MMGYFLPRKDQFKAHNMIFSHEDVLAGSELKIVQNLRARQKQNQCYVVYGGGTVLIAQLLSLHNPNIFTLSFEDGLDFQALEPKIENFIMDVCSLTNLRSYLVTLLSKESFDFERSLEDFCSVIVPLCHNTHSIWRNLKFEKRKMNSLLFSLEFAAFEQQPELILWLGTVYRSLLPEQGYLTDLKGNINLHLLSELLKTAVKTASEVGIHKRDIGTSMFKKNLDL